MFLGTASLSMSKGGSTTKKLMSADFNFITKEMTQDGAINCRELGVPDTRMTLPKRRAFCLTSKQDFRTRKLRRIQKCLSRYPSSESQQFKSAPFSVQPNAILSSYVLMSDFGKPRQLLSAQYLQLLEPVWDKQHKKREMIQRNETHGESGRGHSYCWHPSES